MPAGDAKAEMALESLVITLGRDGMVAFEKDAQPAGHRGLWLRPGSGCDRSGRHSDCDFHCGAGSWSRSVSAARLANFAGGIVVMKRGTATVSNKELLAAIDQYSATYIFVSDCTQKKFFRENLARSRSRVARRRRGDRAGQWLL